MHRAHAGLKDKKGRVLNEVGLFLGQGRDDVARGDFLCMVKGVQVYGESLDDTHAMKISDTSFVVPNRRSDAHICGYDAAGCWERGAQRLRNRTMSRTRRVRGYFRFLVSKRNAAGTTRRVAASTFHVVL